MSYFNNDIIKWEFETEKEHRFKDKCRNLVELHGEERLLAALKNEGAFKLLFANNLISENNIYFFLLKQFYLLNVDNRVLSTNVASLDFAKAQNSIFDSYQTRVFLLQLYLNTMNIDPHTLVVKKLSTTSYDNINKTLTSMQDFYQSSKVRRSSKIKEYSIEGLYEKKA